MVCIFSSSQFGVLLCVFTKQWDGKPQHRLILKSEETGIKLKNVGMVNYSNGPLHTVNILIQFALKRNYLVMQSFSNITLVL